MLHTLRFFTVRTLCWAGTGGPVRSRSLGTRESCTGPLRARAGAAKSPVLTCRPQRRIFGLQKQHGMHGQGHGWIGADNTVA